jgi:hypothetical protein
MLPNSSLDKNNGEVHLASKHSSKNTEPQRKHLELTAYHRHLKNGTQ